MASKVELAKAWRCNRKTATRIVHEFNLMGFLHSVPSNRTTIHTLKCLSVWFTNQGTVKNKFFVINPMVTPIGKMRYTVYVPPDTGRKPTENDRGIPTVPAATPSASNGEDVAADNVPGSTDKTQNEIPQPNQ